MDKDIEKYVEDYNLSEEDIKKYVFSPDREIIYDK